MTISAPSRVEPRFKLDLLTSPGFLIGLSVLLLNDFVLKDYFHNWLTGKLSDFAGLLTFALFWTAFFPRFQKPIFLLTGATFVFWKSVYSQPRIDAWNGLGVFSVQRAVDDTDLTALLILPLAYIYSRHICPLTINRAAVFVIATLSLLAFAATSRATSAVVEFNESYAFAVPRERLVYAISHRNAAATRALFSCLGQTRSSR